MDDTLKNKMTVLEEIMADIAKTLFQRWANNLPENQRSEEELENLSRNATEATYFVIQLFMNKFNEAAEQLKADSSPVDQSNNI